MVENPARGRIDHPPEEQDVSVRGIAIFAAVFASALAAVLIALWLIYGHRQGATLIAQSIETYLEQVEVAPEHELETYREAEKAELDRLGWKDRERGIAVIPIADAIDILAAQGVPTWPEADGLSVSEPCQRVEDPVPRAPQARPCDTGGVP